MGLDRRIEMRNAKLVKTSDKYDFYRLSIMIVGDHQTVWNIVPKGSKPPEGGYPSQKYIEGIKGERFDDENW